MKIASRVLKLIVILLFLLLLAVVAFVATFDANNYRTQIIEQVENATGREFRIDGEMTLSVFPWIGLKVEQVALGNAEGFSQQPLAAIKQLDIKVNILPLLKKNLEVNTIRLHGLNASLEVAQDKTNNWTLAGSEAESTAGKQPEEQPVAPTDGKRELPLQSLLIEGFELIDAQIQYSDLSSSTSATVSELNLTSSAITFDKPVKLAFDARVRNRQPLIDTRLQMTTQLTLNRELNRFEMPDFVFTVFASAAGNAGLGIRQDEQLEVRSSVSVLMEEQRITLKSLQINALGLVTRGDFTIAQFLQQPLIQGDIEILPFNARATASRAGVELPVMARQDALAQVSLKSKIKLEGNTVSVDPIQLKLDDYTLTGWLHVVDLATQQLRYALAFDRLNVNDYLPPQPPAGTADQPAGTAAAAAEETAASGNEKIALPLELLRKLDIQGEFRINALTAMDYEISQLLMALTAQQGDINIKPLSMQLLDGEVNTVANMNVQQAIPAYRLDTTVKQVQAGPVVNPFLEGIMGDEPLTMEGAVNMTMAINTTGETINQLKQAARGQIVLDMNTTRVEGFDPEYYMRSSVANYFNSKSEAIMGSYDPREVTVFDSIHSTVKLADGKADTRDFLMDSRRVQVGAEGYADIVQNSLDVTSFVKLPRGKTTLEKILDSPLYVRVHGPFAALQYDLDEKRLKSSAADQLEKEAKAKLDAEKQRLEEEAKEKARKEVERAEEKLKNKLQDKLKDLF